jgi:hypothetical protein
MGTYKLMSHWSGIGRNILAIIVSCCTAFSADAWAAEDQGIPLLIAAPMRLDTSATSAANREPPRATVDATTLDGKLIMGFQGWFACPGDGHLGNHGGWVHWFAENKADASHTTVDMLPDVSELGRDELCPTPFVDRAGRPIYLFSDQNPKTVQRQFNWMKQYGIDGVALQRFLVGIATPDEAQTSNRVLHNVRAAAEASGRVFFLMYDTADADPANWVEQLKADWLHLLRDEKLAASPAYLHDHRHPVLAIAGLGQHGNRPATPQQALQLIRDLRRLSESYGGVTLVGSIALHWRTLDGDSRTEPEWAQVYRSFDVISPWTVGAYRTERDIDNYINTRTIPDLAETKRLHIEYMPVVFPGTSWINLMTYRKKPAQFNAFPRDCGRFYESQVRKLAAVGIRSIFGAMFDEVDESTAMFKIVPDVAHTPVSPPFVTLDVDGCHLRSDWYLRLAGTATMLVQGKPAAFPNFP